MVQRSHMSVRPTYPWSVEAANAVAGIAVSHSKGIGDVEQGIRVGVRSAMASQIRCQKAQYCPFVDGAEGM